MTRQQIDNTLLTLTTNLLAIADCITRQAQVDIAANHAIPRLDALQAITAAIPHLHTAQRFNSSDFNFDLSIHTVAVEIAEAISTSPNHEIAAALRAAYRVVQDVADATGVTLQ